MYHELLCQHSRSSNLFCDLRTASTVYTGECGRCCSDATSSGVQSNHARWCVVRWWNRTRTPSGASATTRPPRKSLLKKKFCLGKRTLLYWQNPFVYVEFRRMLRRQLALTTRTRKHIKDFSWKKMERPQILWTCPARPTWLLILPGTCQAKVSCHCHKVKFYLHHFLSCIVSTSHNSVRAP